jgi:hypothetical protein
MKVKFISQQVQTSIIAEDGTSISKIDCDQLTLDLVMTENGSIKCKVKQNDIKINANPLLLLPFVDYTLKALDTLPKGES